jgi:hypothetical protein
MNDSIQFLLDSDLSQGNGFVKVNSSEALFTNAEVNQSIPKH